MYFFYFIVVFIKKNKTMSKHLTLKEFKEKLNDSNLKSKPVNVVGLGGNDTEEYGMLLDGLYHFLNYYKYDDITLSQLTKTKNKVSIQINSKNSQHVDSLIFNMIEAYGKTNSAKKLGTNTLEMNLESKSSGSENSTDRRGKIAVNLWNSKVKPFISTSLAGTQAMVNMGTTVAESNEIDSNIIIEEINRIKEIMNNG